MSADFPEPGGPSRRMGRRRETARASASRFCVAVGVSTRLGGPQLRSVGAAELRGQYRGR